MATKLIPQLVFHEYINGTSIKDLAKKHQCSVGWIRKLIQRAKKQA